MSEPIDIILKPCPFCGLAPKWFYRDLHETIQEPIKLWWVVCNTCGCGIGFTHGEYHKERAAERWNQRAELFPREQLKGSVPVVLYFPSEADRDDFIKAVQEVNPWLKAEKV